MSIWQDLGVSSGTAIIVLVALYFIIKWAVKNGMIEAYKEISDEETAVEKKWEAYYSQEQPETEE